MFCLPPSAGWCWNWLMFDPSCIHTHGGVFRVMCQSQFVSGFSFRLWQLSGEDPRTLSRAGRPKVRCCHRSCFVYIHGRHGRSHDDDRQPLPGSRKRHKSVVSRCGRCTVPGVAALVFVVSLSLCLSKVYHFHLCVIRREKVCRCAVSNGLLSIQKTILHSRFSRGESFLSSPDLYSIAPQSS